jgi:integrase/recombinase XerD
MNPLIEQINRFVEHMRHSGSTENTVAAYDSDLRMFLKYLQSRELGVISWQDVGTPLLQQFVTYMRNEQQLKDSTITRRIFAVRAFFHFLRSERVIANDPCKNVSYPAIHRPLPRVLSDEEIEHLLAQPAKHAADGSSIGLRDHAILETLYASGMRVSQLISLRMGDVDIASGTIRIMENNGTERLVLLSSRATAVLRTYLERGRMRFLRDPASPALFLNRSGKPLSRQGIWLIIKRYVKQAGIDGHVTTTTLRHSFARHHLAEGANLRELQAMLGHASPASTRAYLKLHEAIDET